MLTKYATPIKPRAIGAINQTFRVFNPEKRQDIVALSTLLGVSVISLLSAIMLRDVAPKMVKTGLMAMPVLTSGAALLYSTQQSVRDAAKFASQTGEAETLELQDLLKHDFAFGKSVRMLEGKYRVAALVAQIPDPVARRYFAQQFDVDALIPREAPPPPIEVKAEPITLNASNTPTIASQISQSRSQELDYTWLDTQTILNSKCVLGAKGSGKSFYLALEAWEFMRSFPEGRLIIIDKHYDGQPDTDRAAFVREKKSRIKNHSLWFLGVPDEVIRKHWVISLRGDDQGRYAGEKGFVERIVMAFKLLEAEMTARNNGQNGGRNAPPFKIIFDEFVGSMMSVERHMGKEAVNEIVNIVTKCEFEWRKFWGRCTLGMHSIKKDMCGIDSSVILGNMDLLALGNALADPNTRFPADMDIKQTLKAQQDLQNALEEGEGFACVYRAQSGQSGHKPEVKVMPVIQPEDLWFDLAVEALPAESIADVMDRNRINGSVKTDAPTDKNAGNTKRKPRDLNKSNPDRDLYLEMKQWYKAQVEKPTNDEIRAKWLELKGVELSDAAINDFLRPRLEED